MSLFPDCPRMLCEWQCGPCTLRQFHTCDWRRMVVHPSLCLEVHKKSGACDPLLSISSANFTTSIPSLPWRACAGLASPSMAALIHVDLLASQLAIHMFNSSSTTHCVCATWPCVLVVLEDGHQSGMDHKCTSVPSAQGRPVGHSSNLTDFSRLDWCTTKVQPVSASHAEKMTQWGIDK